jgi:hypothetical protein
MPTHAKRAVFVIAVLLAFTMYAIGRRVGLIVSGRASPMVVGFVAVDALHRFAILAAAAAVVCVFFYWQQRRERQTRS